MTLPSSQVQSSVSILGLHQVRGGGEATERHEDGPAGNAVISPSLNISVHQVLAEPSGQATATVPEPEE